MSENSVRPSMEEIQRWLLTQLAGRLKLPAESLKADEPLDSYALDSVAMIEVLGDLEQWLGRRIDPEIVFECTSVSELAQRLGR